MKKNRTKIVFSDVSHLIVVLSAQKWICLNILETVDQLLQGMLSLLLRCDLSRSTSLVCSMNHISLSLRPSPKDDDDLKNTIFFGFHFTLCYQILNLKHLLRILKSSIFFPYTFHNYKFKIIAPPPKKKTFSWLSSALYYFYHPRWLYDLSASNEYACSTVYDQWEILVCLLLCNE